MTAMSAEVTRELLQTSPVEGMPGWEMRLFLINYPPGAEASNHSHPVVGIGLMLEGTMISAFDNDPEEDDHSWPELQRSSELPPRQPQWQPDRANEVPNCLYRQGR
jgi:hypothetical protein